MSYRRILLKLSGEGLSGQTNHLAIDPQVVNRIALQVKQLVKLGIQVGIVVGGGNFWRGVTAATNGIERVKADYIGMLATVMNALALQSSFEQAGIPTAVQSAISMEDKIVASYSHEKAIKMLENNMVVIFAGGTGRPYFTTDTAAALVAAEIHADVILMAKNGVDGVYDGDPKIHRGAKRYEKLHYDEVILKGLKVIDLTAASMARENNIDTVVFDITESNSIVNVIENKTRFTVISKRPTKE